MEKGFTIAGALLMALAVGAGAFGAHGLRPYFERFPDLAGTYDTAVRYHMIHALAMFVAAWAVGKWPSALTNWSGILFIVGMVLFSGSLYVLVLTRVRWLGAITPFGGVAFIVGWLLLALAAWRS
jgi:uncharacterized membrane protein YgdD (TMEM256/DUF423 family)